MKRNETSPPQGSSDLKGLPKVGRAKALLSINIGDSIDLLVEYLCDNGVKNNHPLSMGEVEKRLIVKVLERSRGNKLQAAERLGISRNTFHRKVQRLRDSAVISDNEGKA
jgi:transcriptional regulator of acetoin/glycerol metabolism